MPTFFHVFEFAVDAAFAVDILLTLNTAYLDEEGHPVRNRWSIFKKYAKGWLIIDVVSVMPLHIFYTNNLLSLAR